MGLKSPILQFEKNALKTIIFFKSLIFEPKNCEVIETSYETSLNFSPLKCTYSGKIHFNNISAKSEKKLKLKSGHLELRFSVCDSPK